MPLPPEGGVRGSCGTLPLGGSDPEFRQSLRPGFAGSALDIYDQLDKLTLDQQRATLEWNCDYARSGHREITNTSMRRIRLSIAWLRACFGAAVLLLSAGGASAGVVVTQPYVGVTFITRTEITPWPLVMHIAFIDLGAPGIRFKLTPPGGTLDTVRQRTVDFLDEQEAALAIPAHFFLPFPSEDTNANV